jgi:heavy metal translocating P-type ATPase
MTRGSQLFAPTHADSILIGEYFSSGMDESVSPFLTDDSRRWGHNLPLKISFFSAFLLAWAYFLSFFPAYQTASGLLILLTFFFAGVPALIEAIKDIAALEINIDVLMSLAAFLSVFIGSGREGALLLVLFSFSGALEEAVRTKAKGAISSLKKLSPTKAHQVKSDGSVIERSVKDIKAGTHILVKAGEVAPLDGKVVAGLSSVNMVHLTGESLPVTKDIGDQVAAGSQNLDGALTLNVTHTSSNSTLAKIIHLITEAQKAKPKLGQWLDEVSSKYATTVIILSFCFAAFLPLFISIPYLGISGSIYRALAFLIAASPCALILAVPIAYLSAISASAKAGVILKGGAVLDSLAECTVVALDKTGTLTTGELKCSHVIPLHERDPEALAIAFALEQKAEHPIARSICRLADEKNSAPVEIEGFRALFGSGLIGKYKGKDVAIGNAEFILPQLESALKEKAEQKIVELKEAGSVVAILNHGEHITFFLFEDELRPLVPETIHKLTSELGLKCVMLTGDHERSAEIVAKQLELHHYHSALSPKEKLQYISELAKTQKLIMVGDGINDAPALARAHVGISMGKMGSSTAVDVSDVILVQDRFELIEWVAKKAKLTTRIVKQNLTIASVAILAAVIPALIGWVPLWLAVILHEGGTVLVGLNALRLLRR